MIPGEQNFIIDIENLILPRGCLAIRRSNRFYSLSKAAIVVDEYKHASDSILEAMECLCRSSYTLI